MNIVYRRKRKNRKQFFSLCNFDFGLWANIAQVIFLCNVGQTISRQHFIGYFSAKRWFCALGQLCTNNFLVQCCLRGIQTTLARRYSYAMLGAFRKTLHRTLTNKSCPKSIKTSLNRTFCMQWCLELQKQHCVRSFCVIMSLERLSGQYCTDKSPVQCCPRGSKQH